MVKKKRTVAIVHFNTPELTEAAILSVKKHGGDDYEFVIFDNSDKRPFTKKMKGVKILNNRKGRIINFDKELAKYPDRDPDYGSSHGCNFGSDKHMMSVQKLWELIPDGFVLMDSDVLIKQNIDFMFMDDECCCGHLTHCAGPDQIERLAPFLLWINVPMCKAGGARFFDPDRAWALHKGIGDKRNFWDTGAAFLNDIRRLKPQCHGITINIKPLIEHFGGGSWVKNDLAQQQAWLEEHRDLWYGEGEPQYTVLTYIFDGYEKVHEIKQKDPRAEYILVTDDQNLHSKTWNVVYDPSLSSLSTFDKCYEVRFHPFNYAKTDVVVRIDGSIGIKKSLRNIVDVFNEGKYDRCMMIHPNRDNIAKEYDIWVQYRAYPVKQAAHCLMAMEHLGYDFSYKGMFQGCFEIVRKSEVNEQLNGLTFHLLKYLGIDGKIERLDQTVTSFVTNHLFDQRLKVMPVSQTLITSGEYMQWYLHNSDAPIQDVTPRVEPFLFNEPCDVLF